MIVGDVSAAYPKLAKAYHDRLVVLMDLYDRFEAEGRSDRDHNLILYLMRRAWRPLYQELRARYVKLWGKKASFSYFFPQHTHNAIWRRACDTRKAR